MYLGTNAWCIYFLIYIYIGVNLEIICHDRIELNCSSIVGNIQTRY